MATCKSLDKSHKLCPSLCDRTTCARTGEAFMQNTKKPVSELTGPELSAWVARAQGWIQVSEFYWKDADGHTVIDGNRYEPHINGGQCFELIEKFEMTVGYMPLNKVWYANGFNLGTEEGETASIAVCRAVVASVYGECVEVEE